MRAPAGLVAVPLVAGTALAFVWVQSIDGRFAGIAATAALLALWAAVQWMQQDDRVEATLALALAALLVGLSLGASGAAHVYRPPLLAWFEARQDREPVVLIGRLRDDAVRTAFGVSLAVDVESAGSFRGKTLGGIRLTVAGSLSDARLAQWTAGRRIRAPALLRLPSGYFDPGVPDERPALARRGVVLVGTVKSAALVEVVRRGSPLDEAGAAVRARVRRTLARYVGPRGSRASGVAAAVLIGDRSGLADEDERRLQEAGTYHVIAISGGNIAVLAVLAMAAARLFMVPTRIAAVFAAMGLLFYGLMAGGAASVSRAVTVAVLVLAARVLDHRGPALNTLAVAAALMLASAPETVFDPGFILSFGATIAILAGVPTARVPRRAGRLRRLVSAAWLAAATLWTATVCAEIALAPIGAVLFGRVTAAGLVLNFLAIPLMTIVQLTALVVCASSGAPPIAGAAGVVCHLAATALVASAGLLDVAPWLAFDVRPPGWPLLGAYYACALGLLRPASRRAAAGAIAVLGVLLIAGPDATSRDAVPAPGAPLRIAVLDVGQGDATVVQLPGGRALLVDTGGLVPISPSPAAFEPSPGFDIGDRVVFPALRALGIRRLSGLVLTHGDPDHIQGAEGVLRHIAAPTVWEGVPVPPHPGLRALIDATTARGMSWRTVQAGDAERFGPVALRVLHPPAPEWERQRVRNDDSIVLELRIGRVSVILPGDIGAEGERAILPRLEPGRLVVLKAPHHGSATSSGQDLIDRLRPAAVIFSCGRDNRFGHPHPSVVARYRAAGAAIFSTADDGAVFVETDGDQLEMRAWRGRRALFEGQSIVR